MVSFILSFILISLFFLSISKFHSPFLNRRLSLPTKESTSPELGDAGIDVAWARRRHLSKTHTKSDVFRDVADDSDAESDDSYAFRDDLDVIREI